MNRTLKLALAAAGCCSSLVFAQSHMPPDTDSGPALQTPASQTPPVRSSDTLQPDTSPVLTPAGPVERLSPVTQNGVTYLCGGVGLEEAAYMKQQARSHDMLLTFATNRGSYLSDVNVTISTARGEPVLHTSCGGPMMVLDLPASGTYKVHAEADGFVQDRVAHVNVDRHSPTALVMTWPQRQVEGSGPDAVSTGSSGGYGSGASGQPTRPRD